MSDGAEITTPGGQRRDRDIASILLVLGGLTGLVLVAFAAHPLAGWALLALLLVAIGLGLGVER